MPSRKTLLPAQLYGYANRRCSLSIDGTAAVRTPQTTDCGVFLAGYIARMSTRHAVLAGLKPASSPVETSIRDDTRGWWTRVLADDVTTYPEGQPIKGEDYIPYRADAQSLLSFPKDDVLPIIEETATQTSRRPAIRLDAHGESMDPFRVDRIFALDERLTRQFEKTLAMLIRLREISALASSA